METTTTTQTKPEPELGSKEYTLNKMRGLNFNSKAAIIGAGAGLAYAILRNRSKILFVLIGAVGGALIGTAFMNKKED